MAPQLKPGQSTNGIHAAVGIYRAAIDKERLNQYSRLTLKTCGAVQVPVAR